MEHFSLRNRSRSVVKVLGHACPVILAACASPDYNVGSAGLGRSSAAGTATTLQTEPANVSGGGARNDWTGGAGASSFGTTGGQSASSVVAAGANAGGAGSLPTGGVATGQSGGTTAVVAPQGGTIGTPSSMTEGGSIGRSTSGSGGAMDTGRTTTATTGSGGATGTGGAMGVGGATDSSVARAGGPTGAGGAKTSGGAPGAGGTESVGSTSSSGGTTSSSTAPSSGGASNSAGGTSSSTAPSSGGTPSAGGSTSDSPYCSGYTDLGTLVSSSTLYKAIPAEATCLRFTVAPINEVFHGIQMSNCGTRTVTINGKDSGCSPGSNCSVTGASIPRAADGYWYLEFSACLATNCTSTWWWSA
jgi:hypothetical protein